MKTIKHGIIHNGIIYGWIGKELYRLPQSKGTTSFGLKKMTPCGVGNATGYYMGRRKKTIAQLQAMTSVINFRLFTVSDAETPF
jgi:hypothetical protein